jgi:hypothetical protein
VCRRVEENECLGNCRIVEADLQRELHGQTRTARSAALRSRNHGETSWPAQYRGECTSRFFPRGAAKKRQFASVSFLHDAAIGCSGPWFKK